MKPIVDEMNSFLQGIQKNMHANDALKHDLSVVKGISLSALECMYVFSFFENKILYQSGFDRVFGYNWDTMKIENVLTKFHQDDAPFIRKIVTGIINQFVHRKIPVFENLMNLSYRFQKSDGTYARILSDTAVYDVNAKGIVQSILVKYTDISFTQDSEAVEWKVNTNYLDLGLIESVVYDDTKHIFSPRELEVIKYVLNGNSNKEVAKEMHISEHTVATHRKNVLFKSACHNLKELKRFCINNGIEIEINEY